jgi:hypothetical protein
LRKKHIKKGDVKGESIVDNQQTEAEEERVLE